MNLNGGMIRDNFDAIKNGLKSTIDFLKQQLNLYSIQYMP